MEKKNKKILIIEDDIFISEMYMTKFKSCGWNVYTAENGHTGLKKSLEKIPDVILLDIIMPRMDGFEMLKAIKKDKILKNIPVIILSNLGQKEEIKKGLDLGADDYIIKAHFTPQEIVEKVEKQLAVNG